MKVSEARLVHPGPRTTGV